VAYLVWGFGAVASMAKEWAAKDLKSMGIQALGILLLAWLVAYIVNGIRSYLKFALQWGVWPWSRIGRRLARARRDGRYRKLQRAQLRVSPFLWAQGGFGNAWSPSRPTTIEAATSHLDRVRVTFGNILGTLDQAGQEVGIDRVIQPQLEAVLSTLFELWAHRDTFPAPTKEAISKEITAIKEAVSRFAALREALAHLLAEGRMVLNDAQNALAEYPSESRLRPTRFGNVVSNLESYPSDRYGIGLPSLWPRLLKVMSGESYLAALEDATIYLAFTVVMSFLSLIAAGIAGIQALAHPDLLDWLEGSGPGETLGPLFLSWFFYRLSVLAVQFYGERVKSSVDLFRLKLLDELSLQRPSSFEEEKKIWSSLHRFIVDSVSPGAELHLTGAKASPPLQAPPPAGAPGKKD
jgi:hypothetical protein